MKISRHAILSLSLLVSPCVYAVHAQAVRYNNQCLDCEHRGNPDKIDELIFGGKPLVNHDHVMATPTLYVTAPKELIDQWCAGASHAITARLTALHAEIASADADTATDLLQAAAARLSHQADYLTNVQYPTTGTDGLIALPEQDVVFLMQWAKRIISTGDEVVPALTIVLDDVTTLVVNSSCGDLPAVIQDHIYWQKVVEAGWVAVDSDSMERVQPILHPDVIGEKFHFYKTRFGVYFRETLSANERVPGDLLRIVKYLQRDPRHNASLHGNATIVWLKFPADPAFNASLDGQYLPNAGRAKTATWVYAHDLQALYTELQNQAQNS